MPMNLIIKENIDKDTQTTTGSVIYYSAKF